MGKLKEKIIKGVFWFTSGAVAVNALNLLTHIILVRALSIRDYGLLSLALSAYAIFLIFSDFGIGSYIVSDIAGETGKRKYGNVKALIKGYSKLSIILGTTLAILSFILSFTLKGILPDIPMNLLLIISLYLFVSFVKNIILTTIYGFGDFKNYNILTTLEALFKLVSVVVFIYLLHEGVVFALFSYVLGTIAAILLMIPVFLKKINKIRKYKVEDVGIFKKYFMDHGKWIVLSRPITMIAKQSHYWIAEYFLGVNAVAILSVALRVYSFLYTMLRSIGATVFQTLCEQVQVNKKIAKILVKKSIKYSIILSILMILFTIIFSNRIVSFLFTDKYLSSGIVLVIVSFSFPLLSINDILRSYLYSLKKQKIYFHISIISSLSFVILQLLLICFLGLIGIAVVFFINPIAVMICYIYVFRNIIHIKHLVMFAHTPNKRKI